MSDVKEKIEGQIEIDKEILSVLPKNNKKNLKLYQEKAAELKLSYESYLANIISEMKRRVIKIMSIKKDDQIEALQKEISNMDNIYLLNENTSSFEKMKLDEILFVLKRFYKNNLEIVNDSIAKCLEKFKMVGIELKSSDFNYSIYTKEYMTVFFAEFKRGDLNSELIKSTFEEIYWKCPDIIIHIELNFRSLYLKNEKNIDNYFAETKKHLSKELNLNYNEAINKRNNLKNKLEELNNEDTAVILQKFISLEENIKEYDETNIKKLCKKMSKNDFDELSNAQINEFEKNILKLSNTLYEYRNFLKFKYLYDETLNIFNDKQKYKAAYNTNLKQIEKLESKLFASNKKIEKYNRHRGLLAKLFKKNNNKLEKTNTNINSIIADLKTAYRDLDANETKCRISANLNENSTIFDALNLIYDSYSFLVDTIIKQYEDMDQETISEVIKEFRAFMECPDITVLNNIKINENKDIALVIKDKYNLCNINMVKGDLEEDNIPGLMQTVQSICTNYYIKNSRVNVEDIKFVLEANKYIEE